MFGVYVVIVAIIGFIIRSCRNLSAEQRSKEHAIKNGYETYRTRNGYNARVSDDVVIAYKKDLKTGDVLEYSPLTGRVYRNVTKEREMALDKQGRDEAIKKGETLYCYDPRIDAKCHKDGYRGKHFKDLTMGKRYVKRLVEYCGIVLLNIDTCQVEKILNEDQLNEKQLKEVKIAIKAHNKLAANGTPFWQNYGDCDFLEEKK